MRLPISTEKCGIIFYLLYLVLLVLVTHFIYCQVETICFDKIGFNICWWKIGTDDCCQNVIYEEIDDAEECLMVPRNDTTIMIRINSTAEPDDPCVSYKEVKPGDCFRLHQKQPSHEHYYVQPSYPTYPSQSKYPNQPMYPSQPSYSFRQYPSHPSYPSQTPYFAHDHYHREPFNQYSPYGRDFDNPNCNEPVIQPYESNSYEQHSFRIDSPYPIYSSKKQSPCPELPFDGYEFSYEQVQEPHNPSDFIEVREVQTKKSHCEDRKTPEAEPEEDQKEQKSTDHEETPGETEETDDCEESEEDFLENLPLKNGEKAPPNPVCCECEALYRRILNKLSSPGSKIRIALEKSSGFTPTPGTLSAQIHPVRKAERIRLMVNKIMEKKCLLSDRLALAIWSHCSSPDDFRPSTLCSQPGKVGGKCTFCGKCV